MNALMVSSSKLQRRPGRCGSWRRKGKVMTYEMKAARGGYKINGQCYKETVPFFGIRAQEGATIPTGTHTSLHETFN